MSTATISRWARRFLVVSAVFLVAALVASLLGASGRVEVVLGLQGLVLTAVFGKTYSLVPSYFDRTLVWPNALAVHLPLGVVGVALGGWFALDGVTRELTRAHLRVNGFGLLGTTIVGVVYQFYPPAVARWPGTGDGAALATISLLAVGITLSALGRVVSAAIETAGLAIADLGAVGYLYLLVGSIHRQLSRR